MPRPTNSHQTDIGTETKGDKSGPEQSPHDRSGHAKAAKQFCWEPRAFIWCSAARLNGTSFGGGGRRKRGVRSREVKKPLMKKRLQYFCDRAEILREILLFSSNDEKRKRQDDVPLQIASLQMNSHHRAGKDQRKRFVTNSFCWRTLRSWNADFRTPRFEIYFCTEIIHGANCAWLRPVYQQILWKTKVQL